jgi:hypothetical protein
MPRGATGAPASASRSLPIRAYYYCQWEQYHMRVLLRSSRRSTAQQLSKDAERLSDLRMSDS